MNRLRRFSVSMVVCLLLVPTIAWAQRSDTSGFAGAVKDSTGAMLPGVTVEVSSPALIEKMRVAVTDNAGQYRIVDLRPGIYTITFSLTGFGSVTRDGIELPPNFTAPVNVELTPGSIEESITVTGQSPIVDVQNVVSQQRISEEMVKNLPVARSHMGFAAMTAAVIMPSTAQDVGGSMGENTQKMAAHGAKQGDQKHLMDGLRYNTLNSDGSTKGYFMNVASVRESVITLGAAGGSAEQSVGGVLVNLIPHEGGNRFAGSLFTAYTGDAFQSDNLTPELQAEGLTSVNTIESLYDASGTYGGPVLQDKLWFFTAHRWWGVRRGIADSYRAVEPLAWTYTPDLDRPNVTAEVNQSHSLRMTGQATTRQKVSLFFDWQHNNDAQRTLDDNPGTTAWEAATSIDRGGSKPWGSTPLYFLTGTWNYAPTSTVFLEAGAAYLGAAWRGDLQDGVSLDTISVLEQSTNFRYRAPVSSTQPREYGQNNQRFNISYVTGTHNFKAGVFRMAGTHRARLIHNSNQLSYRFNFGVPNQLTQYSTPVIEESRLAPEFAVFAQDQWTHRRLTLSFGVRYESFSAYVPASTYPADRFLGERSYDQIDCVPCWKDFSPRLGVALDLFGNGRTAIKANAGRYTKSVATSIAEQSNPGAVAVTSVTRNWNDANRNLAPDCDLRSPLSNGECGQMSNVRFGQSNIVTRFDPEYLNGWFKNEFNWQASLSLEHELRPGLAMKAAYYRTWFGNFRVTDNLAVAPADFDEYCITAPADPRLPDGGGNRICGLYNISPEKFGQVDNLINLAENYGEWTEVYNGVDLNLNWRGPGSAMVMGGLNIGNQTSVGGNSFSSTSRCFVVDSPQELYQCDQQQPYRVQLKLMGSVPLPWSLMAAANFQSVKGPMLTANYTASNAEVQASLGRPLSGNASTVTIPLIQPYTMYGERINQLDVRLSRSFRLGSRRLQGSIDVANLLNSSASLDVNPTYGPNWLKTNEVMAARLIKIGAQIDF